MKYCIGRYDARKDDNQYFHGYGYIYGIYKEVVKTRRKWWLFGEVIVKKKWVMLDKALSMAVAEDKLRELTYGARPMRESEIMKEVEV